MVQRVENPPSSAGNMGSISAWGTTDPTRHRASKPMLHNKRSPCTATGEKPPPPLPPRHTPPQQRQDSQKKGANPKVLNSGLWAIMMCHCRLILGEHFCHSGGDAVCGVGYVSLWGSEYM